MKLFQKLLLAPAALGLMAPVAASAADLNIAGVSQYGSEEQVTSITQFSDVKPTDWAYQALSNLIERYGCVAGYPNGTYKGGQAMTRYEAAALLNACLDRITEVTDELKRLMKEFEKELAVLKGRVDGLEAKVGELEATQFSTTTKLKGIATFVLGSNSFGGNVAFPDYSDEIDELREDASDIRDISTFDTENEGATIGEVAAALAFADSLDERADALAELSDRKISDIARYFEGGTTFNYDVRLNFDTSFTGKDLLRTTLRAGNFADSAFGGAAVIGENGASLGLNSLEVAFQENCGSDIDCGDVVAINRLFYQFPIADGFTATVGARVRQDDMLAMWPSVYPADTILDIFTYAGSPGTYSLNLGAGAGLWYQKNGWSISLNYVSANADGGSPNDGSDNDFGALPTAGGIGTDAAAQTFTAQVGYAASNWGAAVAYNYGNGVGIASGTPLAVLASAAAPSNNSVGLSAYWQPSESGWIPSISAGWGVTSMSQDDDTFDFDGITAQSWYVGLQWNDAFIKGNSLGMAVGQGTFITGGDDDYFFDGESPKDGNYAWEWWYKFQVTDNISITPAIFYLSNPLGELGYALSSADDRPGEAALTNFGAVIKTTFKF